MLNNYFADMTYFDEMPNNFFADMACAQAKTIQLFDK